MKSLIQVAVMAACTSLCAVAPLTVAHAGIPLDFDDVAIGYPDGYYDGHHRWHHWAHPDDYKAYGHAHPEHYRDYGHDRDEHHH